MMTIPVHARALALVGVALTFLSNCAPSEVAPPRDAATELLADAPRDLPEGDAATDGAPADVTHDGPCGDGGVCGGGQRCDPARMRCVDCLAADHCGGATPVCASGRCVAAAPCNSSRMCPGQVCDLAQMRCVDCVTDAECDAGQRCVANVCVAPVTCRSSRDCSAGGLVCNVAQMRCVECLEDRDCAMGSACTSANVCRAAACAAGARRCVSATRVAVCDARGAAETETDCSTGEVCTGGECRRPGCTPGAATCTSTTERRVCNADGMTFATMPCPAGQMCSGGACATAPGCPTGQALCGSACIDLLRDANHCGICGRACAAGMICAAGACSAPTEPPAPMITARAAHALVTLPDGRVLAAGGSDGSPTPIRAAEIYDPTTNRWQSLAPTNSSLARAYGVLLRDGRVAVSGSHVGGEIGAQGTLDVYTPSTNTWVRLTNSGLVRPLAVTHELGGHLYVFDIHFSGTSAHRYTLATGMWSPLARYTATLFNSSATVAVDGQGRVHLLQSTNHAIYSPADDAWTMAPALSVSRTDTAGALGPDGRIYLSGGFAGIAATNDLRALDPMTNTITTLAPMPDTRGNHRAVFLPGGRMLVTGGVRMTAGRNEYLNTTAIYTIATNTWR